MASAESKTLDQQGLEAGLSYIGLEAENAERRVAAFWAMYESGQPASVNYPERYSLKTEEERRKEAKDLAEMADRVPSSEYKRQVFKKIANVLIGHTVTEEELQRVYTEIDKAKVLIMNPDVIAKDIEQGVLSLELAAVAKGYPNNSVKDAAAEHADRLARIAISQAKGPVVDTQESGAGAAQKAKVQQDKVTDAVPTDKVRGEGQ